MKYIIKGLILTVFLGYIHADIEANSSTTAPTSGGTIAFCANWNASQASGHDETLDNVNVATYEANEYVLSEWFVISNLDANGAFEIVATHGGWTLPDNYFDSQGKHGSATDDEILVQIDETEASFSDGWAAADASGSSEGLRGNDACVKRSSPSTDTWCAVTTGGTDIIHGGYEKTASGGTSSNDHGVENAACKINLKVMMDWLYDIPSLHHDNSASTDYDITVTLTLQAEDND